MSENEDGPLYNDMGDDPPVLDDEDNSSGESDDDEGEPEKKALRKIVLSNCNPSKCNPPLLLLQDSASVLQLQQRLEAIRVLQRRGVFCNMGDFRQVLCGGDRGDAKSLRGGDIERRSDDEDRPRMQAICDTDSEDDSEDDDDHGDGMPPLEQDSSEATSGVLGNYSTVAVRVEYQSRGALHMHMCIMPHNASL